MDKKLDLADNLPKVVHFPTRVFQAAIYDLLASLLFSG